MSFTSRFAYTPSSTQSSRIGPLSRRLAITGSAEREGYCDAGSSVSLCDFVVVSGLLSDSGARLTALKRTLRVTVSPPRRQLSLTRVQSPSASGCGSAP